MIYSMFKNVALGLLKSPAAPPEAPAGSHRQTQIYRASPGFLTYRLLLFYAMTLLSWLGAVALLTLGLVTGERPPAVIAILTMIVLAIVQFCVYFAIRIDYEMRYYVVTDRSIRVREGAVVVKEMTISFANVQNMRAVQGPLMRFFGIKHLEIDTAGGGGGGAEAHGQSTLHRVRMAGIDNADDVRADIQEHLRQWSNSAGLGDPEDRHGAAINVRNAERVESPQALDSLRALKDATRRLRDAAAP